MSDNFVDFLIRQKWQEVVSGFHNFVDSYGIPIIVAACVLIVWVIRRITKKQKHA